MVTDWIVAIASVFTAIATGGLAVGVVIAWQQATETLSTMKAANIEAKTASEAAKASSEAQTRAAEAAEASSIAQAAANEQAERDSIRRTRPYVYVELVPGLAAPHSADLRIFNAGQSSAKQLTLVVDDWPEDAGDHIATNMREMCETPRTLPPGCGLRALWRLWTEDGRPNLRDPASGEPTATSGLPRSAVVRVRYTDDAGAEYSDEYTLMLDRSGLTPLPGTGSDPTDLGGAAGTFHSLGREIARHIAELRR